VKQALPLISCLCPSRGRPALLAESIACFQAQTYPHRELLLLLDPDDAGSLALVAGIHDPRIRCIYRADHAALHIGVLRNLTLKAARGTWIATWDDDDWQAPERLAAQWAALAGSGRKACVLWQVIVQDMLADRMYLSEQRAWEPSILVEKTVLPPFIEHGKAEDTPVVHTLYEQGYLLGLRHAALYAYRYHGSNITGAGHWLNAVIPASSPLSAEESSAMHAAMTASRTQAQQWLAQYG
jgi:glycosyltransferase involved in cell wall biosynthesis